MDHLERKIKPRKEEGMFKGVPIDDDELGEDNFEIVALSYGDDLNEDEREYLKLPNSLTDFANVDVESAKTEVRVMEAKLRMSIRNQDEEDGAQGVEEQEAELAGKRVYDETERVVDFRKKKVTDTGLNKRITLPDPVDMRVEVKIQDLVNDLDEAISKAGGEERRSLRAGNQSYSTLTDAQQRGQSSILARERAGELIVVLTDKSGKRAVMTPRWSPISRGTQSTPGPRWTKQKSI